MQHIDESVACALGLLANSAMQYCNRNMPEPMIMCIIKNV